MDTHTLYRDMGDLGERRVTVTYTYHPAVEAIINPIDKAEEGSAEFIEIEQAGLELPLGMIAVELTELAISEISEIIIAECHQ
jgi:hypothetical protein